MPPLAGPRSMECCTLNPVNTSSVPSSICTGTCTITSRLGSRSIFHRPSSSPSFFAAKSERRTCACQGLTSSRYAVVITPLCAALVFAFDTSGTTVYPSIFAPTNERQVVRDDYFPKDVSLAARGAVPGALFTALSPTFDSCLQVCLSTALPVAGD